MKKIIRYIILGVLLLATMTLCSTFVIKIFDIILQLKFENIWYAGFKVGLIASALLLIDTYRKSKHKTEQSHI